MDMRSNPSESLQDPEAPFRSDSSRVATVMKKMKKSLE